MQLKTPTLPLINVHVEDVGDLGRSRVDEILGVGERFGGGSAASAIDWCH